MGRIGFGVMRPSRQSGSEGLSPAPQPCVQGSPVFLAKVPASEAPAAPGTCPASGIRVSADEGDAAMGLRVVGLHLDNCGTGAYSVEGYPLLELLDDDLEPVDGVEILDGSGEITTGAGPDEQPGPVTLEPGESATTAWSGATPPSSVRRSTCPMRGSGRRRVPSR